MVTYVVALNPISATNYLGSGFDARYCKYSDAVSLAPIFTFTYTEGKQWISPYSHIVFDVPDQMVIKPFETVFELSEESVSDTYTSYLQKFTEWFYFGAEIEVYYFGGGLFYEKSLGYVNSCYEDDFVETIHGFHLWTLNAGTLYPQFIETLDPMFQLALDKFPVQIITPEDKEYATEFVQTFGTHYPYRAIFGAKVLYISAINQIMKGSYSSEWVSEQYGLNFHYLLYGISSGGFYNRSDITVDKEFLANSRTKVLFYGGDPILANLTSLDEWVKTIDNNTFPMNVTMVGLWNLITNNNTKQETLKNFIVNYLNNGFPEKSLVKNNQTKIGRAHV